MRQPHRLSILQGPPPAAIDERSSKAGLRAIATFEAIKGTAVLALAIGLLALIHRDLERVAESLLVHLHINSEHRLGQVIMHAATTTTSARLWALSGAAVAYSTVRYVEAWGLWNRRVWAEWFALLSGTLYLPLEILKLSEEVTWMHLAVFSINVLVLLYMLYIRIAACREPHCLEKQLE